MSAQEKAATRDELADAALKHYEELVKAAWPNGSSLSTIPQAIETWRVQPELDNENERLRSGIMKIYMSLHGDELKTTGRQLRAMLDGEAEGR